METPPQFYPIRDLMLLPRLNPRSQLCEETIIRYMESFDSLPPVSIQEGTGVLVDGFHRVEAASRLGAEVIPVQMLDIPDEELHLYAGLANCNHGRALSRAERNRFVVRLVEEFGWPADRVARTVGISASSVHLALREHRYNQALSERLGEEVEVINSSHVQALYRVGDEQRTRLLDAIASKIDEEGRPRPLTGGELKSLVDLMENPATPTQELRRLLEDPLARPEAAARRRPAAAAENRAPNAATAAAPAASLTEVEPFGPLDDARTAAPTGDDLRGELLERALAREEPGELPEQAPRERRQTAIGGPRLEPLAAARPWAAWQEEPPAHSASAGLHPPGSRSSAGADPQADRDPIHGAALAPHPTPIPVLENTEERCPAEALREAEGVLCDLCSRVEDAELWEQIRAARDLVREAVALLET